MFTNRAKKGNPRVRCHGNFVMEWIISPCELKTSADRGRIDFLNPRPEFMKHRSTEGVWPEVVAVSRKKLVMGHQCHQVCDIHLRLNDQRETY
jgi:hypothetical protein